MTATLSPRRATMVLLLPLCLMLSSCQPIIVDAFDNYQQRLSKVLQLPSVMPATPPDPELLVNLPAKPQWTRPKHANLSLLDMMELRGCAMGNLIAERNNSLGKVQPWLLRLEYEIALQQSWPDCQQLALSDSLRQKLTTAMAAKAADVPALFQHVLQEDQSLRQQLFGQRRWIKVDGNAGLGQTQAALQSLLQLQQHIVAATVSGQWSAISSPPAVDAFAALYQSQVLADLSYSTREFTTKLQQLNQQLWQWQATVQQTPSRPVAAAHAPALPSKNAKDVSDLCPIPSHRRAEQLPIVQTIFQRFYLGHIQPYSAALDGYSQQLVPLLLQLYPEPQWQQFIQQRYAKPAADLRHALQQHVQFWQWFQQHCGAIAPRPT
jgi:hypothetical protein